MGSFFENELSRHPEDNILLSWNSSKNDWNVEHWKFFTLDELNQLLDDYRIRRDYTGVAGYFCLAIGTERQSGGPYDSESQRIRQKAWAEQIRNAIGADCAIWSLSQDALGRIIFVFSVVDTYVLHEVRK